MKKIARVLKHAVQEKLRIVAITLLVFTAIYPVALYVSLQRYNIWVQETSAWYEAQGIPSGYVDFKPYHVTFEGGLLISFGTTLAVSWSVLVLRGGKHET